jgi:hypothetical protein
MSAVKKQVSQLALRRSCGDANTELLPELAIKPRFGLVGLGEYEFSGF